MPLFNFSKNVYLLGTQVILNGDQQCQNFIATQNTYFEYLIYTSGLILTFKKGRLVKAVYCDEGRQKERPLMESEQPFEYVEYPKNFLYKMVLDRKGPHQIGGEVPADFKLPDNKLAIPFQYLGYITNKDKVFRWLPFTLHLACPIYLGFDRLYLDYSNPGAPVVIGKEIELAENVYENDLNSQTEIVFQETKVRFKGADKYSESCAGVPNYLQYPEVPMCPKSGRRMKFVCQLDFAPPVRDVPVKYSNIDIKNAVYASYYKRLNFWGDGNLYVFFEPTSRVACYFIQKT
jgi:hypothetical protein